MIKTNTKWGGKYATKVFTAKSQSEKDIIKNIEQAEKYKNAAQEKFEIVKVYSNFCGEEIIIKALN